MGQKAGCLNRQSYWKSQEKHLFVHELRHNVLLCRKLLQIRGIRMASKQCALTAEIRLDINDRHLKTGCPNFEPYRRPCCSSSEQRHIIFLALLH